MPPAWLNQRSPVPIDTPTAIAASSVDKPARINTQNRRCTSRGISGLTRRTVTGLIAHLNQWRCCNDPLNPRRAEAASVRSRAPTRLLRHELRRGDGLAAEGRVGVTTAHVDAERAHCVPAGLDC